MSATDEKVMPPVLRDAMEKARSEADIMPRSQVARNFTNEYGTEW